MGITHLDLMLQELARLQLDSNLANSNQVDQLSNLEMDLKFLKMFIWCHENCDYADIKELDLGSLNFSDLRHENLNIFAHKFQQFKEEIKRVCFDWVPNSVLQIKSSNSREMYDFIVCISRNLEGLVTLKSQKILPFKKQIEGLQGKLKLFADLAKFADLREFRIQLQDWAYKIAFLSILFWVFQLEGENLHRVDKIYVDIIKQIKPSSLESIRMFFRALKNSKVSSGSDTYFVGELIAKSVDMLLLEDPVASTENLSKMPLIRDGLIILITYIMDPPMVSCGKDRNEILAKANVVLDEAASVISCKREGTHNERNFIENMNRVKAEIRENYIEINDLSNWPCFPRTNGLGFIDLLLENLKERASSILFANGLLLEIREKLISLRPRLKNLIENQSKELQDLWRKIINVAYAVEHVADSCFIGDNKIWYTMIHLEICLEEIDFVTSKVKKMSDLSCNGIGVEEMINNSSHTIPKFDKTSRIDEAVVGFKAEIETMISRLTNGSEQLEIVSIVGMPGQGKTTLAKKVYGDPLVKYHFNKLAWCFVSQFYQWKDLLLDILSDVVTVIDDEVCSMKEEEIAEQLYRRLKGQRYLIVLDDIWDIEALFQLKESFPNDNNGSRIVFTSRIHSIASQSKLGSSTHLLRPLSTKESWELLQHKLFGEDEYCPPNLSEVGLRIAVICDGLPLSLVAVAGVLAKRVKDFNWWKEIATDLSSKILGEGCMNVLELSYKHLPDVLKPCFLYFGAFPRGKVVNVQKLTQLWVAEGFIHGIGMSERPEGAARDFLMDLIGRSLVIVAKRSSNFGIKECRIHDLLFDFVLAKMEEERFLSPLNESQYLSGLQYEEYRLSIHSEWKPFAESNPTALYARSLLLHHGNWNRTEDNSVLMKFKLLRVLNLDYGILFYGFPEEIISHILLRYLTIRGSSISIPTNIDNLQNLEFLCVHSSSDIITVPDTIWKMKRLRVISLRRATYFSFENSLLVGAQLENVDTLSWPILCHNEYGEKLLRRFPNVRKLRFRLWDPQTNCPKFPILDSLSKLESLNVICPMGIHQPYYNFRFPSTLKKLTLIESRIQWSEISAISKLPNLEVLKLYDAFVGEKWDVEDEEFLNLKFLKLQCSSIQQWNVCDEDPFPCLECLVLEDCYKLEEIPSDFGEISTLNQIEVRCCSKGAENSAREILIQQQDIGNDGFNLLITGDDDDDDSYW